MRGVVRAGSVIHSATRRPTARMPYRQEREQTLTASILYGRRKIQYSQHA